ncbi:MAG: hypothetical protein WCB31_09390 [Nitrososphaeraceae archaeon]
MKDFIKCYNPENRHKRKETEKVNLDIFWLRDESLEDSDNLPPPNIIVQEIVETLSQH